VSDDGKIWTSSGVSAGTDCFLSFLEKVYGGDDSGVSFADQVSAGMEYTRVKDWKNDPWAEVHHVQDVPPVA
jgi:transcriptional regulator GlxA family with amidase domain